MTSWLAPPGGGGGGGVTKAAGSRLSAEADPDAVHIFTVASGHMYERLQKIMVLSVLRNTQCALAPLRASAHSHASTCTRFWELPTAHASSLQTHQCV